MVTTKLTFTPSHIPSQPGTIHYVVTTGRSTRRIPSSAQILPSEWDTRYACIAVTTRRDRRQALANARTTVQYDLRRIHRIAQHLETQASHYTAADIARQYNLYLSQYTLNHYTLHIIDTLRQQGRPRTAETYTATLRSIHKFLTVTTGTPDIPIDHIGPTLMQAYQAWLCNRHLVPNTISFYIRILRAIYRRAIDAGIVDNLHPFTHTYTGIEKTTKRALPISTIRQIKNLDLSYNSRLDYARDIFILSSTLKTLVV